MQLMLEAIQECRVNAVLALMEGACDAVQFPFYTFVNEKVVRTAQEEISSNAVLVLLAGIGEAASRALDSDESVSLVQALLPLCFSKEPNMARFHHYSSLRLFKEDAKSDGERLRAEQFVMDLCGACDPTAFVYSDIALKQFAQDTTQCLADDNPERLAESLAATFKGRLNENLARISKTSARASQTDLFPENPAVTEWRLHRRFISFVKRTLSLGIDAG